MICEKCGTEVSKNDKYCQKCGEEVKIQTKKNTGMKKPITVIGFIIVVVITCVIMKYKAIIPLSILAIVCVTVIINRKILKLRKKKTDSTDIVEEHNFTDAETKKISEYFVSREEKYISSLGNSYIMNFFINGNLRRGFAIISDKRVYFRGSCFSGQGKDLKKTDEERTVDIKDVTGSGFIYRRYLGVLLGLFTALVVLLGGIGGSMFTALGEWEKTQYYQQQEEEAATDYQTAQGRDDRIAKLDEEIKELEDEITSLQHKSNEQTEHIMDTTFNDVDYTMMIDTEFGRAYLNYYSSIWEEVFWDNEVVWYDDMKELYEFNSRLVRGEKLNEIYSKPIRDGFYKLLKNITTTNSLYITPEIFSKNVVLPKSKVKIQDIDIEFDSVSYYQNFLNTVVPELGNNDSYTEINLNDIMMNYMENNSFTEWAEVLNSHMAEAESNVENDADMNELKTEINNLNEERSNLLDEKEKVSEMSQNVERYERRYNDSKQESFEHYMLTTIAMAGAGLLVTFFISCIAVFVEYLSKRKTLFEIQYAGGRIAFDVSYYAKAEIDDFQKQLRRAKDFAQETATVKTVTVETSAPAPVQASTQSSVPEDLRKYADLLKEGLISQEEYDAMKKKILGL